ncbi:hypothetical protein [Luteolibacter sp. Populi]|uniref:hypothetical protein n=1 Tax=Luteolibacter sp. Populi TaxID=3230487 RepID=UPI0034660A70
MATVALSGAALAGDMREAPNPGGQPANQLSISGNACGPAALLSSYRCGNAAWQTAAASLPGSKDREQIGKWIRAHGLRPSETLKGRTRWTSAGINVEDLVTAANEMGKPLYLPVLVHDGLFVQRGESGEELLQRVWRRLNASLEKGVPPVLSLRRQVLRKDRWTPVQGHFVTVTGIPKKLGKGEGGFQVVYLDPWGGKRCEGWLKVPERAVLSGEGQASPCLVAEFPAVNIGKKEVRRGEVTAVVPETVIGRW